MTDSPDNKRRDFLQLSTLTIGAVGTAAFIWPFLKSMNPAEDTLALGSTEVDISGIEEGQSITVKWRGKPVFIKRRTTQEIKEAKEVLQTDLKDIKEHPPTQSEYMPKIVEKLKECYDPEISVDIYNLGLIYDVKVTEDGYVHVLMSLTSAFCPAADMIPRDVQQKVESIPNLKCKVKITMQPQWGRDMINPEIRDLMGL